jgi:hypothetical protein
MVLQVRFQHSPIRSFATGWIAAAIVRRNPDSVVIPFDTQAYNVYEKGAKLDPSDSILSLSARLSKYGSGGTDCSLPFVEANRLTGASGR